MAEVLPSSPQYVGGGGGEDEHHGSSNSRNLFAIDPPRSSRLTPRVSRVFNRSPRRNPFDEEKISMAVRGHANGRTSASASSSSSSSVLFNICKGDTTASAEDDDEEEQQQQQQRSHSMNPCEENNGNSNVNEGEQQPWILALLLATFRRSLVACKPARGGDERSNMEISWPTNVQHVAHVTFDRFNGFLGLPVEFEMEIPRRVPSASASVFGVSAESMQLSYDSRGNSVPTILLLMQQRLYSQGGLKAEGIFRINAENSQEENVRDQLNKGVVPDDIDVHCLAGLIKAWFRELPTGVLDTLTPEQVLQCNEEKDYVELVKLLPPTQVALLNWSINLMTDVVQEEECNKMNARNIAMVFAPNMTQMSDPLNALMHAVRVMNFLQTLILKTLREREEAAGKWTLYCSDSNDEDDYNSNPQTSNGFKPKETSDEEDKTSQSDEYLIDGYCLSSDERDLSDEEEELTTIYTEEGFMGQVDEKELSDDGSSRDSLFDIYDSREVLNELRECREQGIVERDDNLQLANRNHMLVLQGSETRASTSQEDIFLLTGIQVDKKKIIVDEIIKGDSKENSQHLIQMIQAAVKTRGSVVNSIDQQIERVEAW